MELMIIFLIGIIGFGTLTFFEGKRQGYQKGLTDGYEECKKNFNRIQQLIRNNKERLNSISNFYKKDKT